MVKTILRMSISISDQILIKANYMPNINDREIVVSPSTISWGKLQTTPALLHVPRLSFKRSQTDRLEPANYVPIGRLCKQKAKALSRVHVYHHENMHI